jgi:hypothetical protein
MIIAVGLKEIGRLTDPPLAIFVPKLLQHTATETKGQAHVRNGGVHSSLYNI